MLPCGFVARLGGGGFIVFRLVAFAAGGLFLGNGFCVRNRCDFTLLCLFMSRPCLAVLRFRCTGSPCVSASRRCGFDLYLGASSRAGGVVAWWFVGDAVFVSNVSACASWFYSVGSSAGSRVFGASALCLSRSE